MTVQSSSHRKMYLVLGFICNGKSNLGCESVVMGIWGHGKGPWE